MKLKSFKQNGIFFMSIEGNFVQKSGNLKIFLYDMDEKTFKTFKQTDEGKNSHLKIAHFVRNF